MRPLPNGFMSENREFYWNNGIHWLGYVRLVLFGLGLDKLVKAFRGTTSP